jgi:hypothetical protein
MSRMRSVGGRINIKKWTNMSNTKKRGNNKPRTKKRRNKSKQRIKKALVIEPGEISPELGIIELDSTNNITPDDLTPDTMIVTVIHSSTCPHCTVMMEPEEDGQPSKWQEMEAILAKRMKEKSCPYKNIKIMNIPSTNQDLIDKFNEKYAKSLLSGQTLDAPAYPYIARIHGGKAEKYEGDRAPAIMATWFAS